MYSLIFKICEILFLVPFILKNYYKLCIKSAKNQLGEAKKILWIWETKKNISPNLKDQK